MYKVGDRVLYLSELCSDKVPAVPAVPVTILENDGTYIPYRFEPKIGGLCWAKESEILGYAAPSEAAKRKAQPMFRGALGVFPDALAEVARCMNAATAQHHPDKPLHWDFHKSKDHADCIVRHQTDFDELDSDGHLHATKVAIRSLMQLQTELEKANPELHAKRQAQREKAAKGER